MSFIAGDEGECKRNNVRITEVPEGQERKFDVKVNLKEIRGKDFPKLRNTGNQIQGASVSQHK